MPNRLAKETSPYLLQHKDNPVDWFPWGDEAFTLAKELDRPVFLSVGYSSCHWCHVMERESFEDHEIAALMNELFVNIKVDQRRAPGRRLDLHVGGAVHDGPRRLADVSIHVAGRFTVLRRHLLSEPGPRRDAFVSASVAGGCGCLPQSTW